MSDDRYWSVTTILGEGIPKPALIGWAARVVAEHAVDNIDGVHAIARSDRAGAVKYLTDSRFRTTSEAAARGSELHRIAESYALGQPIEPPDHLARYVDQFTRFLGDHAPKYIASEAPVFNAAYRYAGTLDAIVELDGKTCVLDMKTTPKGPGERSRPPWPEVALQLTAYSRADFLAIRGAKQMTGQRGGRRYYALEDDHEVEPLPRIDGAFALVISPEDYRLVPARIDDTVWNTFLYVREVARWSLETSKTVLGEPVTATARRAAA